MQRWLYERAMVDYSAVLHPRHSRSINDIHTTTLAEKGCLSACRINQQRDTHPGRPTPCSSGGTETAVSTVPAVTFVLIADTKGRRFYQIRCLLLGSGFTRSVTFLDEALDKAIRVLRSGLPGRATQRAIGKAFSTRPRFDNGQRFL